mmetsp:Transcript_6325/g.17679  ORF Transcript_6325/g.17679 Transcript_6325/m.17679 type:complete len:397 (+) Transcript_6325:503-1693(+)
MGDDGFKAGRADIMKTLEREEDKGYQVFANHVLDSYASEQRFGFYTSYSDFAQVALLCKGEMCSVYIAKCRYSRGKVILKAYELAKMSSNHQKILKARLGVMQDIMAPDDFRRSSNDLVRSFGFFEEQGNIVVVLEYCGRTDLISSLQGKSMCEDNLVIEVVQSVLRALGHMHSQGYTHGNLSPENILVTGDGFIKLNDFDSTVSEDRLPGVGELKGASTPRGSSSSRWNSGLKGGKSMRLQTPSLLYMSPEQVQHHFPNMTGSHKGNRKDVDEDAPYTPASDVWAVGCLVYELMVGKTPFEEGDNQNEKEMVLVTAKNILEKEVQEPTFSRMSSECMSFIRFAMNKDRTMRPTVDDLLLHPWIQKYSSKLPSLRPRVSHLCPLSTGSTVLYSLGL